MILPTTRKPLAAKRERRASAFTLVELILVMVLLTITAGIVYPALSGFFRGRTLESEARRFLALTRYAQTEAISLGVPMELWIDVDQGSYGLDPSPGYLVATNHSLFYQMEDSLQLELPAGRFPLNPYGAGLMGSPSPLSTGSQYGTTPTTRTQTGYAMNTRGRPIISFRPDGTLLETSITQIVLRDRENVELWIVQAQTGLSYEIIRPQAL